MKPRNAFLAVASLLALSIFLAGCVGGQKFVCPGGAEVRDASLCSQATIPTPATGTPTATPDELPPALPEETEVADQPPALPSDFPALPAESTGAPVAVPPIVADNQLP